jgi:anti-sigma B factor antagonist
MIAPAYVIQLSDADGTLILGIAGDLDVESRDLVEQVLLAAIESASRLVLDLGELTFCDSSGMAMLIALHKRAESTARPLAFRNVSPVVRRMFEIAGVDRRFAAAE